MNHKITGILLILSLSVPVPVTYTILQLQKYSLKEEIKEVLLSEIGSEDLIRLGFNLAGSGKYLEWENSHEFEYMGCMYDVIETVTMEDSIIYLCWKDEKESDINNRLEELVSGSSRHNGQDKESRSLLLKLFQSLYFEQIPGYQLTSIDNEILMKYYNLGLPTLFYPPPVPPPEQV